MAKELARELVNAGVHFGHGANRWNPKMAPYIFGKRGNIHIIDVKQTLRGVLIAKKLLAELVSSGSDVVFVGTKRQAQKAVEGAAAKCQMHFISQRWLGGMLTNFRTVRSRLQRLEQLEAMEKTGTLEKESKKQASRLKREMRKIFTNLDGVRRMSRLPGCVVVVDAKKEYLALREAKRLGIPTIGVLDTDSDPDTVDVAIPANDDSIKAIDLILSELADAVSVGKTMMSLKPDVSGAAGTAKRGRSRRVLARADGDDTLAAVDAMVSDEEDAPSDTPASDEATVQETQASADVPVQDAPASDTTVEPDAPASDVVPEPESDEQKVS
ncbi:MAG: 30S ribosomal protein S2 [Phycisphaerae bacterium]|nr:30S ribosomal protein S2 [Phycisphaerae bacterium]